MMVILNTRETAQRFCDYAGLRNIVILKQAGLKFVIDIKHEKEAIEFQQGGGGSSYRGMK